jgi:hypothetical protein
MVVDWDDAGGFMAALVGVIPSSLLCVTSG